MEKDKHYTFHMEALHGPLEPIDTQAIVDGCGERWFNQTLCAVNDCVVRIGIIEGEFHWHQHIEEDEFFYVQEGRLLIDLEDRTVELSPKQGFLVPRGVTHRTRAPEKCVIIMVEGSGVVPAGD